MNNPNFDWDKEFEEYLNSLNTKDCAKLLAVIRGVEKFGLRDSIQKERVKRLDKDIYEIRALTDEHWLRGCYFQIEGSNYYITHGFSKKTKKTPKNEIKRAKDIRIIFKRKGRGDKDE